ncbi:YlbG family protein [Furfurilactobacillus sp. WILCCON 0119]
MSEQQETTAKKPVVKRPRRHRSHRPRSKEATPETNREATTQKPTNSRRPRRRHKKPTGDRDVASQPVASQAADNQAATSQPAKTQAVSAAAPVAQPETVVRAELANAFVDHEPTALTLQPRQALSVYVRNLRQVRQLRRFGDIDYVSKKLHYAVIYMDADQIEQNRQAINKLSFVRRVMVSERPVIDPFVGHGVNANFVTHTENDGAADADDQTEADS